MGSRSSRPSNIASEGWAWWGTKIAFRLFFTAFAICGLATMIFLYQNQALLPDIPMVYTFRRFVDLHGEQLLLGAKFLIQTGGFAAFSFALLFAVIKVDRVSEMMSNFTKARGEIYSLVNSVSSIEEHSEALNGSVKQLSDIEPTIKGIAEQLKGMAEQIEASALQIAELQRFQVSERTIASPLEAEMPPADAAVGPDATAGIDVNWERLRELWYANGSRLDAAIDRIPNSRVRKKIRQMPKTNYPAIIEALFAENQISAAARNGSLQLHAKFMSYKPRNRPIPDDAVAALIVLDSMLAQEFDQQTTKDGAPITQSIVEKQASALT